MDLPTYTSIWRIEKRLYKLYDFRLPMPVPVGQIAVFAAITVPYVILLTILGLPFNHSLFWLYVLPPGVITWLATRPVLESKRLPELIISQVRYLGEPGIWCRMAPLAEKDDVVVIGKVWRRDEEHLRSPPRPRPWRPPPLRPPPGARPACGRRPHATPPRKPPRPSHPAACRVLLRHRGCAPRVGVAVVRPSGPASRPALRGRRRSWRPMRWPRSPTTSGGLRSAPRRRLRAATPPGQRSRMAHQASPLQPRTRSPGRLIPMAWQLRPGHLRRGRPRTRTPRPRPCPRPIQPGPRRFRPPRPLRSPGTGR